MNFAVYVKSIDTLIEFKNGLGEFCSETQQSLDGITRDIRRLQEWLAERQRDWQRRVEEDDEDCEAYEELQNVIHWRRVVEEEIENYTLQARRMAHWINDELPKARNFLAEAVNKLERVINVTPASAPGISLSTPVSTSYSEGGVIGSTAETLPGQWQEKGIQNVPVQAILSQIDLGQSHVKNAQDFTKIPYDTMVEGCRKLAQVVLPAVANGADRDYFARLDQEHGLQYEHGYERIYDAFYGGDAIRLTKRGNQYDIINGYHRLFVAKELGLEYLPASVVEHVETV